MTKVIVDQLWAQVRAEGQALGADIQELGEQDKQYLGAASARLSLAVGHPGFAEAVEREALNVANEVAQGAVAAADNVDGRIVATIRGGLSVAAAVLS